MSKQTTIYVLFKEYPDPKGRRKSALYIHDSEDFLADKDALMKDWRDVADVLLFFGYEKANRYYDEDNLDGMLYVADTIPAEYPAVSDFIRSEVQAIGLTSWRTDAAVKTDTYYFGQNDVTNDLLGDMSQRESNREDTMQRIQKDIANQLLPVDKEYEPCVLLHKGAINGPQGEVLITMKGGRSIRLRTVDSIGDMHDWLSQHRFPHRRYKFNPKHGDAYNEAQTYTDRLGHVIQAAQLLTTKEETEALLNQAVGDSIKGDLWYYDTSNDCCIYFENQGNTPQHEFHAYHLRPGEKNYDKINFAKLDKIIPKG